jgi:hypothetical protein
VSAAILTSEKGFERRARLLPWGIEVQVWRLVETVTFPPAAGALSLASLLAESSPLGAGPVEEDEDGETLENFIDGVSGDGKPDGK